MSIFGDSYCKFVTGSTDVLLEHSVVNPMYIQSDVVDYTSVFNGYRGEQKRGDYTDIEVVVFLCSYDNPADKLKEIEQYKGSLVKFYPHIDGNEIHSFTSESVYLYFSDCEPFYLTQDKIYDAVKLKFKSEKYTHLMILDNNSLGYGYLYATMYGTRL